MAWTDRPPAVLFISCLMLVCLIASPCAGQDSEYTLEVSDVTYIGVQHVDKAALAATLAVNPPPLWKIWRSDPVVSIRDVEQDVARIRQFYQARGYYEAKVDYFIEPVDLFDIRYYTKAGISSKKPESILASPKKGKYHVVFKVKEGPPVITSALEMDCLCEIETLSEEQLRERIPVKTGRIFDSDEYDLSKYIIRKALGNKGYPYATVKGSAQVSLQEHKARVRFSITPGNLYYFGEIQVVDKTGYVNPTVISRAIMFKSGEQFSLEKLNTARRNLFGLGIFATALVETGKPDTAGHTVPVIITVMPRKQRTVQFGAGYGTDDGLRLQAAWIYRNLTGWADRLSISARHSDILDNIQGEYGIPYFLSAHNQLLTRAGFEREDTDFYDVNKIFSRADVSRKMSRYWFINIGYNLEASRLENLKTDNIDDVRNSIEDDNYYISSLEYTLEKNTTDDALNPTKGYVLRFTFEDAERFLGSETTYYKPTLEVKGYLPVYDSFVLASRARFRTIQATGDTKNIPIFKKLFLGGSKSVRGYDYQRLGVINEHGVMTASSGVSSFDGNVELRFPLYRDFSGVLFFDTGVLSNETYRYDFGKLRYTAGLGLRYNTVLGPIQLDFGYKLNPPVKASGGMVSADEVDTAPWRLHLNVGQAF